MPKGPRHTAGLRIGGLGLLATGMLILAGCLEGDGGSTAPAPLPIEEVEFAPELGVDLAIMEERPSGLWLVDEEEGEGPEAEVESQLVLDYEGWLPSGALFDSSLESGQPLELNLSFQDVIPGFAEGILGMQEGGQRLILIPPHLGYGAQQVNTPRVTIPPNSWLVFRVYMRSVET
jgi:FKBP-type peptidyl-prolyl cis-trans isomerase FkpA